MLSELAAGKPDVIVFELGDGLLGTYGVDAILECADIRSALSAVLLSANDPVAAWGGVKLLRERFAIEPCAVTGPATDNEVGVEIITRPNAGAGIQRAWSDGAALADCVIAAVGLAGGAMNARRSRPWCSAAPVMLQASCCGCSPAILILSSRPRCPQPSG